LKRIADGSYGICARCHSAIPVPRLEALPFTSSCVKCAAHG
jgi:RNA polymerase-binding transcription factor DksA